MPFALLTFELQQAKGMGKNKEVLEIMPPLKYNETNIILSLVLYLFIGGCAGEV